MKYSLPLKNKCRTCNERWAGCGKSATSRPYGVFRREQDFEPIQGRLAGIQFVKSPDQMEMGVAQEGTAGRKYVSFKKEISRYPGKSTGHGDLGLHTAVLTERTNLKNVQHLPRTTSWGVEKLTGICTNGMLSAAQPHSGCSGHSQRAWPRHLCATEQGRTVMGGNRRHSLMMLVVERTRRENQTDSNTVCHTPSLRVWKGRGELLPSWRRFCLLTTQ